MSDTLLYIGNVAMTMIAMAIGYRLLLKRETFHGLNRVVLLLCLALPWVLPFCGMTIHRSLPATDFSNLNDVISAGPSPYSTTWWITALLAIYCIGVEAMLIKSIIAIIITTRIIANGVKSKCDEGYVLVKSHQVQSPFNWMSYIVMPDDLQNSDFNAIKAHELAHFKKRHTLDLIFAEVVLSLQWFNPAAWMLRADLQAVHEFEADNAAVQSCDNYKEYEEILIGQVTAMSAGLLANGFTEQTLKQRIIMLHKKKSSRKRVLKALYLVAIIAASMVANAKTVITPELDGNDAVVSSDVRKQAAETAQQVVPQDKVTKQAKSFSVKPDGTVESHYEGSAENYQYYLDGKPISDPSSVSPSQVKSMKVMHDGEKMNIYMFTTEQPGAKTITNIQTSTTFTDNEGNKTIISDDGFIKYGYEFYVDGERRESIADIPNDRIASIVVDKSEKEHPKVHITLKK